MTNRTKSLYLPPDIAEQVESLRAAMTERSGVDVSFSGALVAAVRDGIPVRRRHLGLADAPPAPVVRAGEPTPNRNAARDAARKVERERRAALGCECKANHKRECPLFGEKAAEGGES